MFRKNRKRRYVATFWFGHERNEIEFTSCGINRRERLKDAIANVSVWYGPHVASHAEFTTIERA